MELNNKLFDYLKSKIITFEKTTKNGNFLFSCPNLNNHRIKTKSPSATVISGSDKIICLQCEFKGTIFDAVRVLEPDKKDYTDEQITDYLINSFKVDIYTELEIYKKYGWSLVPVAKNARNPIEKDWTNITHYEKSEWMKWLNNGLNIGVRTGEISKITVIDVDAITIINDNRNLIVEELRKSDTLMQNSPHGTHFVYQYDKDIPQTVNINGMKIDIRNDGGQILIQPSKRDKLDYHWKNLGEEIKVIPENIKSKILELMKVENSTKEKVSQEIPIVKIEPLKLKNNNLDGCCNDTFIQILGKFTKFLTIEQTEKVGYILNNDLLEAPMPSRSIKAMIGSIEGYTETEQMTQEKMIYECLKLLKCDIKPKDVVDHTGLKINIVNKYLSKLTMDGVLYRVGRGCYDFKDKLEWGEMQSQDLDVYPYKIPFFEDIAHFQQGDIILLGGLTGRGKTHQALNIVKDMVVQGVKPYYISFESGSRYKKIAETLKLKDTDFYVPKEDINNPLHVSLEKNAFTIIDWIYLGDDFAATPKIFNHLKNEMKKSGGILVLFTQLKEGYDWFAKNLIKDFVALSARYIMDDENTGKIGHWDVDKIREPKGQQLRETVMCEYNFDTKEFKIKNKI